jgi:hypothetical protein
MSDRSRWLTPATPWRVEVERRSELCVVVTSVSKCRCSVTSEGSVEWRPALARGKHDVLAHSLVVFNVPQLIMARRPSPSASITQQYGSTAASSRAAQQSKVSAGREAENTLSSHSHAKGGYGSQALMNRVGQRQAPAGNEKPRPGTRRTLVGAPVSVPLKIPTHSVLLLHLLASAALCCARQSFSRIRRISASRFPHSSRSGGCTNHSSETSPLQECM